MRSLVRLRVELDDRPGSLARVAAAIAARDGNITAIDVLESEAGRVVDEITVDAPSDLDMALLRAEIGGMRDARVLSHQRAEVVDPIVRVVRRLARAIDRLPAGASEELCQGIADLCATPAVIALDDAAAGDHAIGRRALAEPGRAVVARTVSDVPPFGEAITGEVSVVAVATSVAGATRVVMVGRPVAQAFTPTECDRVESLVALYARLTAVVDCGDEKAGRPGVR